MNDSITVQLRLAKGSSTQIRTAVETSTTSSSYVPGPDRDGLVNLR